MTRFVLLALLIGVLAVAGVSCGGGAGTFQPEAARDVQGITEGGFNLIRYSDAGPATDALNPTLDLEVAPSGSTTTVTIAIEDAQPTLGVTVDLNYDASRYTPVDVEFAGLIDTEVELAVTRNSGVVAIGQVSSAGEGTRAGQFATVTFRNEPNRTISAVGDAHDRSIDSQYGAGGLTADGFDAFGDNGEVFYNILGIFTSLSGDGNQDGASNIADLTPLGALLGQQVTATDGVSARADYDGNGLPNISDLTPLGANLGEATTQIELLAGDTDVVGDMTVVATLDWTAGEAPVAPSVDTGDPNEIWRQWNGTIDATTAGDIDNAGNDDDHIFISARAVTSGTGADQAGFTPAVDITLGGAPTSLFIIESLTVEVNGTPVTGGDTVLAVANSTALIEVTGFDGKFNGLDFDPGALNAGTTPTQAEYDGELANINQDLMNFLGSAGSQTLNPGGVANFETDYDVALSANFMAGGVINAQVFPDDQDGNTAEAEVTFGWTANHNTVADFSFTLDVTADPTAPLVVDVRGGQGQDGDGDWIISNTDPDIRGTMQFPGGAPVVFDDTTIDVKLIDLTNDVELAVDFDYTLTPPVQAGTFSVLPAINPGDFEFIVRVPAGLFNEANRYMVRFYTPDSSTHPSSVNKPGEFLTGGAVPTGFTSAVLPRPTLDWNGASLERVIAIIPSDPQILRNPQQDVDILGGTVTNHYGGAGDVLKSDGDFFNLVVADGVTYPQAVVAEGNDPTVIQADAVQQTIIQTETNPHRLVVDLAGFDVQATTTFAYKVFGAPVIPGDLTSRPVITDGTFTASTDPIIFGQINGVDFGINIYDSARPISTGDLTLGSENFSDKTLDVENLPAVYGDAGNEADVLFVQFNGGHIVPRAYQEDPLEGFFANSMDVILREIQGLGPAVTKTLDVRIAGVGNGGLDYIGLGHFLQSDVHAGGLIPGFEYEVALNDGFATPEFSFGTDIADPRIVVVDSTP